MRKKLLTLLFIIATLNIFAQSNIVATCNNTTLTYNDGEVNTYVWSITNNGPQAATNVQVYYPVPAGITIPTTPAPNGVLTFWWTGSNSSSGTNVPLNNTIATLAVNQTVTYTIKIYVPHEYTTPLPTFTVADLEIVNTDNQLYYTPGTPSVYTVTVTNHGPDTATNVVFTDVFPAAVATAGITWTASNGASGTGSVNNTIASLAANTTVTYTITANIPATYTAALSTTAAVSTANVDVNGTCTQCTDIDTKKPTANLIVTNTDGQATYVPGSTHTYTVTVQNAGPGVAAEVNVSNAIPDGITQFSWTGNGASGVNAPLENIITALPSGQSVVYTVTVVIPETFTGSLTSVAAATSSLIIDPDTTCTGCTDTDAPAPGANLIVTNTNGQASYVAGAASVYTVTVTNNGPDVATNVAVASAIPSGITSYSWVGSNGSSGTDAALADAIASLPVGTSVTYTVTLQVPAGYSQPLLTTQVTVTSDTTDPVPGCTGCTDIDYNPANTADIVIVNTDNSTTYTNGSASVYTVTVTNNGPQAATNVVVTGAVPAGVSDFSWTGSNGSSGTGALNNTISSLANGAVVTYTVTFITPDDYYEPITFAVAATSDNDPDTSCTQCSDTDVNAFPLADLVISNTDGQELYTQGGTNTYTVTVTNSGPSAAPNVDVAVPLPAGITAVTWTGSNGSSGTGAVNNTIPSLAVGETVTYTLTLSVPAAFSGPLTVVANATSDATDLEPCTACTDIDYGTASADLVTTITIPNAQYTPGLDAIYTVTIVNNGPDAAQNVVVSNTPPAGFTTAQVNWTGSNGTSGSGNISDTVAILMPGETVTYTYNVETPSSYTANIIGNIAVTATTPDPAPGCTTCTALATANEQANLITVKTDGQTTYLTEDNEFNGELTYTITVTNAGPSDAHNVVVSDPKPYNILQMNWTGSNNTGGISSMNDTIDVLPAGESVTYSVTITVPVGYNTSVGALTNVVTVTSETPDPEPACTGCTDTDTPAPKYVTVTKNQYTIPQLVEDVLIDTDCVTIQNITWSAGAIDGDFGIGYFQANNSNFPLQSGIVIRSGNALNSAGPYVNNSAPTSTQGSSAADTQLQQVSNNNGQFGPVSDVSYIQFEFVPVSDHMSFDFLFASNEYGTYQCSFSDVFAFLLSDVTQPTLMTNNNIALVPGTTTPVSVTNIRNSSYNGGCGSANVAYFGQYNQSNQANAAINMMGQTVKMTAESDVVAGHTYRIKLAIGDYNDTAFDSAVFLAAGSFDIGQPELPTDLTFANAAAICYGKTYDIHATVDNPNMLLKWQKDGEWILDENGGYFDQPTYTVTEPGTYTILGYLAGNPDCYITDDIVVNYYDEILSGDPETLTTCGNPAGTATFNLNDNLDNLQSGMTDPDLIEVYYYTSLEDIANGEPSLYPVDTFQGTDGQTIYVTLNDYESSCYDIKEFTLDIIQCDVPLNALTPIAICEDAPYDNTEVVDLTAQETQMMAQLEDPSQYTVTYHNSQADANTGENDIATPENYTATNETVYVRVEFNLYDFVYNTTPLQIIINAQPVLDAVDNVSACDSYTLPPLTQGQYRTASGGGGSVIPAGTNITSTQTINIFASTGTAPYVCTDEQSFEVTIFPTPVVDELSDIAVCNSYTLPALTVGQYYTAPDGGGIELFEGDVLTTTRTVHIHAESGNSEVTCSDDSSFVVTVNYAPVLQPATPLEACDDVTNNGIEIFDLTPAGAEVVNNESGFTATYYTSQAFANAGGSTGQITSPDAYSSANSTVYIRIVATGTTTNCYSVAPLQLIVHPKPDVLPITDYILCDDTAPALDGIETFDLTTKSGEATTDATDTVTYYTSNTDAQLEQNAITAPEAFQNTTPGQQTIYVRVETVYGCYDTDSFNLIVNPLPGANLSSPLFYACEENPGEGYFYMDAIDPVIKNGQAGYTALYYASEADAVPGNTNNIVDNPFLAQTGTIYALISDDVTGCSIVAPVSLEVQPAPIAPEPEPIEECDFNNDNVTTFNLQPTMDAIEAALGGTVSTTIHETEADANYQGGTNPIQDTTSYTNIEAMTTGGIQTLYIRVNSTTTDCYDVVAVQLIVHPVPVATDPLEDYAMCDNGESDTDGLAIFDLTSYQATVLNTMDPAQYSVSYHTTAEAAAAGTPAIATPSVYTSASGTVYIRVTNNATGCYDVVALNLVVNPLPVANQPVPYSLCDVNNPGDEFEQFDLTSQVPAITGGADGVEVSFYHSYDDAVAGTNPITNTTTYTNATPAVEPIFVKVADNETACYRIVLLDIRVTPLPQLTAPTADALNACDTNGSGYANFDLDALVAGMVNNGVGLTVAFYRTAQDALDGVNPITNTADYENTVPGSQALYVVATDGATGCRSEVLVITLTVTKAPVAFTAPDLTQCDQQDSNNQDNQMVFDLTQQNAGILSQLDATGTYTIEYFTSEANAIAGAPRITVPQTYNGTGGQVIWVRVTVTGTECYAVTSFGLRVNQPQALATPTLLTLCDEALPNNGITVFDLTVMNDYILTPTGIGESNVVDYFTDNTYTATSQVADPTQFTNTVNPQTLFVRVTTPQGCESYSTLTVRVVPRPTPNTAPTPLELCDTQDANLGDGFESFDLTEGEDSILGNDSQSQVAYYTTQAAAQAGDTTAPEYIGTPTAYTNTTAWNDSVWVRVTLTNTQPNSPGCAEVVELPLIVNPLPPVYDSTGVVPLYAICNDPTTGFEQFDLIGHVNNLLTEAGANPTDYTIRFYLDMAAYTNGTALPHTYTNVTPGHQQIVVYVKNNATDCYIVTTLDLYAEQAAVANPITSAANSPIVECDYDGTNDGFTQFDLTPAGTEALGSQSPTQFSVEYYTTEAAAITGDTTAAEYIATPAAYTNTVNPQTIWVRITNTSTFSPCFAVTSFNIRVSLLEEPSISNDDNDHFICVDYKDGTVYKPVPLKSNATTAGDTYQWYLNGTAIPGATSATYSAVEEGIYTVEVWNADGCISDPVTGYEIFLSGPASKIGEGYVVSNAFGDNQTITVLAEGFGDYQYALVAEDANGNSDPLGPWQNSNVFTNVQQGYFTIYVRDVNTLEINPCGMLVISGVSVIDYPKYFTPNGDGINDYWNIVGMVNHPEARIYIFDRYGKLIKQLSPASRTDHSEGWDGTFNGQPLPSDDYWFTVEFTESGYDRTFKAHFAMKR